MYIAAICIGSLHGWIACSKYVAKFTIRFIYRSAGLPAHHTCKMSSERSETSLTGMEISPDKRSHRAGPAARMNFEYFFYNITLVKQVSLAPI